MSHQKVTDLAPYQGGQLTPKYPGGPSEDKPDTHFVVPAAKNKVSHAFTIRVKDCIKSYGILKVKGAEFITPPFERGLETRCFFWDPDGHLFEISEYNG